jgi:3-oxoacyl-[acyl-carrier-protein] synthase II
MVAGATGTRVHPMKTVHALQSEQVALDEAGSDPAAWSRPFDAGRRGMVLGEGAAVLILEELESARRRGARIYAEVAGHGAACAAARGAIGRRRAAVSQAIRTAVDRAGLAADLLGHVHAQGLSTVTGDREEAAALGDVLGDAAARIPTVAAKGNFGNLGAGSGLVECVASILSLGRGTLFPLLNYQASDAACPVRAARRGDSAGDSFVSVAATPQGQAGAVVFRRWPSGPAAA